MTYPLHQRELTVHLNNGHWYLRPVEGLQILGPVDYGWHRYSLYPDSFTFGEGVLAGSSIPGSRRLVFCAWSPQWGGFYTSGMGGAGYTFHHLGVNYVALRGRCAEPTVLLLNHRDGEVRVRLEPVDYQALWGGYATPEGRGLLGVYALQQALYDRYAGEYPDRQVRVFAVGPAALKTQEGGIGSSPVEHEGLSPVLDWAGRGGLGSRLLQEHNVAACVFGGDWEDPDLRDSKEIDRYFLDHFGLRTVKADLAVTRKYRYFPQFETGGTFGVNMRQLYDRILSFNYTSIYASEEERLRQHQDFVVDHYLKQFNEETIATKNFKHCGEPCAVACKKLHGIYKKDFEPYHALGPQVGVFDQRAAELLNDHADAMGFDAIQLGGTLAWIMEIVQEGLIPAAEFGLPPAGEMKFGFSADSADFDLVADSMRNARYCMAVMDALLFDERAAVFRLGIRAAATELDRRFGTATVDRAVFVAHGDEGHMVPNQYWVPGMGSPMPMMGKYFVYYGPEFLAPEKLGRMNVERMVYELYSDNGGICRFHRKWAELLTGEIVTSHYQLDVDYKAHHFRLAKAINDREGEKSLPWPNARWAHLLYRFLLHWKNQGLQDPDLDHWLQRCEDDLPAAARDFWEAIRSGQRAAFADGPAAVPDHQTPVESRDNPSA